MPNTKSVGVAFSDPALVAGTTIDGAVITNPTVTGAALNGSLGATTPGAATVTTFGGARTTVAAAGTDNTNAGVIPAASFLCTVTAGDGTKGGGR